MADGNVRSIPQIVLIRLRLWRQLVQADGNGSYRFAATELSPEPYPSVPQGWPSDTERSIRQGGIVDPEPIELEPLRFLAIGRSIVAMSGISKTHLELLIENSPYAYGDRIEAILVVS